MKLLKTKRTFLLSEPDINMLLKHINNSRKYKFKLKGTKIHSALLSGNFDIEIIYCDMAIEAGTLEIEAGLVHSLRILLIFCFCVTTILLPVFYFLSLSTKNVFIVDLLYLAAALIGRLAIEVKMRDVINELKKHNIIKL